MVVIVPATRLQEAVCKKSEAVHLRLRSFDIICTIDIAQKVRS